MRAGGSRVKLVDRLKLTPKGGSEMTHYLRFVLLSTFNKTKLEH